MLQTYFLPRFSIRGTGSFVFSLTLTLTLLANSSAVLAEQKSAQQNLQIVVAAAVAHEAGGVSANNNWARIEFSKAYIDPIVVVNPIKDNDNSAYVVGIRNVDSNGFEINLKSCSQPSGVPLNADINYSVIENNELSLSEGNSPVRQVYAWGDCPA